MQSLNQYALDKLLGTDARKVVVEPPYVGLLHPQACQQLQLLAQRRESNQRINEYIREHLGVPQEKMPMNIDRFGNTSAGTLPILIDECTRKGMLKKGELNMMLALGAGIHWGCALVRW